MGGRFFIWAVLALSFSSVAQQPKRGVTPIEQATVSGTGTYYALVIGINLYPHEPPLRTAVGDAEAIAQVLRGRYGFTVKKLLDAQATRDNILDAFGQYEKLGENDQLLIYYAGHGQRRGGKAYWLPVDASPDSTAKWIIADDITSGIRVIPARHVLVVSDSCYSGGLAREGEASVTLPANHDAAIRILQSSKSRILISSGRDEPVSDSGSGGHSVFANALLNGLQRTNGPSFTASSLFHSYIRETVIGGSEQVPLYQIIQNSGHDGGDFIFFPRTGAVSGGALPPSAPSPSENPSPSVEPAVTPGLAPAPPVARPELDKAPANLNEVMSQLTVNATFQPAGLASSQITITITPNAGNTTYTATVNSRNPMFLGNLTDGTTQNQGSSFTFNKLGASTRPGATYFMLDGAYFAPTGASLSLKLSPNGAKRANISLGSVAGSLSLTGKPMAVLGRPASGGEKVVSGQMLGTFTETFTADPGGVSAPPLPAAAPAENGSAKPGAGPEPGARAVDNRYRTSYVWIPPGKFIMGCSPGDARCAESEKPRHEIAITKGFWLNDTPVTVDAWNMQRYLGGGLPLLRRTDSEGRLLTGKTIPALGISYADARAYCSQAGGRLPTEAEWEYAARAGTATVRYGEPEAVAWTTDNSGDEKLDGAKLSDRAMVDNHNQPHPVRQKEPNRWNLYDMLGNAWQWTADWYEEGYYKVSPATDPKGPAAGTMRVMRGGSWHNIPADARASMRLPMSPATASNTTGFRCALDNLPATAHQ